MIAVAGSVRIHDMETKNLLFEERAISLGFKEEEWKAQLEKERMESAEAEGERRETDAQRVGRAKTRIESRGTAASFSYSNESFVCIFAAHISPKGQRS